MRGAAKGRIVYLMDRQANREDREGDAIDTMAFDSAFSGPAWMLSLACR